MVKCNREDFVRVLLAEEKDTGCIAEIRKIVAGLPGEIDGKLPLPLDECAFEQEPVSRPLCSLPSAVVL